MISTRSTRFQCIAVILASLQSLISVLACVGFGRKSRGFRHQLKKVGRAGKAGFNL